MLFSIQAFSPRDISQLWQQNVALHSSFNLAEMYVCVDNF